MKIKYFNGINMKTGLIILAAIIFTGCLNLPPCPAGSSPDTLSCDYNAMPGDGE